MKSGNLLAFSVAAVLAAVSTPSLAQSSWEGFYVGGHAGSAELDDDGGESIRFDTDLDGDFGDQVTTATGANAFSPGFCGGAASGPTPAGGCRGNSDDSNEDYGLRAGYDWQRGSLVFGVLGEVARGGMTDSVTAFSTTPAFYTMHRELGTQLALRGRVGFTFGDGDNLLYGTGGVFWTSIENRFTTSNGVNTFTDSGDSDEVGLQFGLGYERRFADAFTVGIEYLMSNLADDDYRVRAQGPAPATNPFILVNSAGTDFRRSNGDISVSSLRLTLNYRF
jgi:opacity protein-like surface antigen